MYKEISGIAKIMGATQFFLQACVETVAAPSVYKHYLIGLGGFPMRRAIRYSKQAPSAAEIDDSMPDDRQLYLYQDKVPAVAYQSKLSDYWA